MKLYGVPLSQPFRSVVWTMLQLKLPFKVEMTVPGLTSKMGTRHENFRSLTPHRSAEVPLLTYEDTDDRSKVSLTESPAIMAHLCERFATSAATTTTAALYPPQGTGARALVNSYTHWHHNHTRKLAQIFQVPVRPDLKVDISSPEKQKEFQTILRSLDEGWIPYGNDQSASAGSPIFIGGLDHPTIADILAYGEVAAITMTNLWDVNAEDYPTLQAWLTHMSQLPHHDAVHQSLTTLGDLSTNGAALDSKQLGAATKAGMQGISQAQASYMERMETGER